MNAKETVRQELAEAREELVAVRAAHDQAGPDAPRNELDRVVRKVLRLGAMVDADEGGSH